MCEFKFSNLGEIIDYGILSIMDGINFIYIYWGYFEIVKINLWLKDFFYFYSWVKCCLSDYLG